MDRPMRFIGWYGAASVRNWMSKAAGLAPCYGVDAWSFTAGANGYRLPTETELEYAARGGVQGGSFEYSGSGNGKSPLLTS